MTLVIGIDPGGTTGLVAVTYTEWDGYRLVAHLAAPLEPGEIGYVLDRWVRQFASPAGPWWIAAERFVVNRRAGRSSSAAASARARNILGALEAEFPKRVRLRNAGAAKAWATNTRLIRAGIYPALGRPHTTDAARHALMMLVQVFANPDPIGSAYRQVRPERA
jgi:predicted NBD/HSP70 family sugar kinase